MVYEEIIETMTKQKTGIKNNCSFKNRTRRKRISRHLIVKDIPLFLNFSLFFRDTGRYDLNNGGKLHGLTTSPPENIVVSLTRK